MGKRKKLTPRQKMDQRILEADVVELREMLSHYARAGSPDELLSKLRREIARKSAAEPGTRKRG